MQSNVIIIGIDKKIGKGILEECLNNPDINQILIINQPDYSSEFHSKITSIQLKDFNELKKYADLINNYKSCFYCDRLAINSVSNEAYFAHNYTNTIAFANALVQINSAINFCYISAAGTDHLEQSNQYSSRINGKIENVLNQIPFSAVYHFRPAIVQAYVQNGPQGGTDKLLNFFYSILRTFNKSYFLTYAELAKAMIYVSIYGYNKHILEIDDISFLANEGDQLV